MRKMRKVPLPSDKQGFEEIPKSGKHGKCGQCGHENAENAENGDDCL